MSFHVLAKFIVVYAEMPQLLADFIPRTYTGTLDPAGGLHPPIPLIWGLAPPKFHLNSTYDNRSLVDIKFLLVNHFEHMPNSHRLSL